MIHHRMHIGREDRLVFVIDMHRRIGPPQKRLGLAGTIAQLHINLEHRFVGVQCKAMHPLGKKHLLDFATPQGHTAVIVADDAPIDGQKSAGAVVLRPVELDPPRNPRPRQPHQGWFDDLVVIDEVVVVGFVERHLHASTQLGQDHNFEVLIFEKNSGVVLVSFFVKDTIYHGVGINNATAALIDSLMQKQRLLEWLANPVGGNGYDFAPDACTIAHDVTHFVV